MIMIGANDGWTVPVPVEAQSSGLQQRLWNASRVYRLLYMAVQATRHPAGGDLTPDSSGHARDETTQGAGPERGFLPEGEEPVFAKADPLLDPSTRIAGWEQPFDANIDAMIELARTHGVLPVLLTYPAHDGVYTFVNPRIRKAATRNTALLVDASKVLAAACATAACEGLFFPDFHATARGNQIVARAVLGAGLPE
jgi:hypothetical protein